MAIYHYSQKPVSRGQGQSAVAGAAYRAGEKLHDERVDRTFDYSRRSGIAHSEIVLPTRAAQLDINWPRNRQQLWNAAELAEKRKDARIAREHEVALPHELPKDKQIALLRAFSAEIANRYNVAVDFALHRPHRKGDQRNYHAHVYSTTREITATGLGAKAAPELSDSDRFKRGLLSGRKEITYMRDRWEKLTNEHLAAYGLETRVDARSLEAQGIDRVASTHLGVAVWGMERRGIETRVGLRVREQQAEEVRWRLERAAELGRLEREHRDVTKSILDLSGDLALALRERERQHREMPGLKPPGEFARAPESEGQELTTGERLRARIDERARELAAEREGDRAARETQEIREAALEQERQRKEKKKRLELEKRNELARDKDSGLEL